MTDEEEKEGLNDEEMENLKALLEEIMTSIDWDKLAEEEEE